MDCVSDFIAVQRRRPLALLLLLPLLLLLLVQNNRWIIVAGSRWHMWSFPCNSWLLSFRWWDDHRFSGPLVHFTVILGGSIACLAPQQGGGANAPSKEKKEQGGGDRARRGGRRWLDRTEYWHTSLPVTWRMGGTFEHKLNSPTSPFDPLNISNWPRMSTGRSSNCL